MDLEHCDRTEARVGGVDSFKGIAPSLPNRQNKARSMTAPFPSVLAQDFTGEARSGEPQERSGTSRHPTRS